MEVIWYISCDIVAFHTSELKELEETKPNQTPQKKQTKDSQQSKPKKAQQKQYSFHSSQKDKKNYLPRTVFEKIGFLLVNTLFSLLIQENQKVVCENQTLLMTDVINSTKMIITQASVVGFHVLVKPSLRQDNFS